MGGVYVLGSQRSGCARWVGALARGVDLNRRLESELDEVRPESQCDRGLGPPIPNADSSLFALNIAENCMQ